MDSIIPQKSISATACSSAASSEGGLSQQNSQELPRRGYAPAAMIGVALSMGACGLLVPHKGDAALAADKVTSDAVTAGSLPTEPNAIPAPPSVSPVIQSNDALTVASANLHIVQEGETLSKIAENYGLTPEQLAQANQLTPASLLKVGQTIALPSSASGSSQPTVPASPVSRTSVPSLPVLKVKQDDAVGKLKEQQSRLKKSLAELRSEESQIVASLPATGSAVLTSAVVTYRVEVGDTLSTIARAHGVSTREILALNQISDPNALFANQTIKLPQAKVNSAVQAAVAGRSDVPIVALNRPVAVLPRSTEISVPKSEATLPTVSRERTVEKANLENPNYVKGLMNEVQNLRQKYQSQQITALRPSGYSAPASVVVPTVSIPPASERRVINPEFNNRVEAAPAKAVRARVERIIQAPALPQPTLPTVVVAPARSRVIASAPIGANGYAPLIQTTALRMTAPQMPSLGTSDNYLPQGKGAMKGYIWPAQGVFTSGYGWRWGRMHRGIDVAGPVGTPIVAAAPGIVSYSGWNDGGYGYMVEVEHIDGSMTRYAHNNRILVSQGQQVAQGQQIAEMGSTGFSTGPHLHFEIHRPEGVVNPIAYLPNDRS